MKKYHAPMQTSIRIHTKWRAVCLKHHSFHSVTQTLMFILKSFLGSRSLVVVENVKLNFLIIEKRQQWKRGTETMSGYKLVISTELNIILERCDTFPMRISSQKFSCPNISLHSWNSAHKIIEPKASFNKDIFYQNNTKLRLKMKGNGTWEYWIEMYSVFLKINFWL